jgi:hypothetical protein
MAMFDSMTFARLHDARWAFVAFAAFSQPCSQKIDRKPSRAGTAVVEP